MQKLICTSLLALSALTANAATPHVCGRCYVNHVNSAAPCAQGYYYVKGEVGIGISASKATREDIGSTTMPFGIAIGYKPNDMFRAELGLRYKQRSRSGNKVVKQFTGLLNGFYDINVHSMFTPYVTAGLGHARIKLSSWINGTSITIDAFAYNAGLGVMANVAKDVDIDLSYRYIVLSSKQLQPSSAADAHEITLGLIYRL